MAIKRFDGIGKKARELEAQAKKLRRDKQTIEDLGDGTILFLLEH